MFLLQSSVTDSLPMLRMGGKTHNVITTEQRYAKAVYWFWQHCQNWSTVTIAMVNKHPFAIVLTKEKKEKINKTKIYVFFFIML